MKYLIAIMICVTAFSANAYTAGGTRIVVEGEILASEWVGGSETGTWRLLVKHTGFLYSCFQSREVVHCSRING